MSRAKYNLKIALKPKTDQRTGKCAPEDLPALRRYQAVVIRLGKNPGMTEEEAIALYDVPRGVCSKCGKEAEGRARRCKECIAISDREKTTKYRVEKRYHRDKPCEYKGCVKIFKGHPRRKFCADHTWGARGTTIAPKMPKEKAVKLPKVKPPKPALLATWENKPKPVKTEGPAPKVMTEEERLAIIAKLKAQEAQNIADAMRKIEEQRAARAGFRRGVDVAELCDEKVRAVAEVMGRIGR